MFFNFIYTYYNFYTILFILVHFFKYIILPKFFYSLLTPESVFFLMFVTIFIVGLFCSFLFWYLLCFFFLFQGLKSFKRGVTTINLTSGLIIKRFGRLLCYSFFFFWLVALY